MGTKVYFDTNVFIRAFEGNDAVSQALIDVMAIETTYAAFATSELTLAELLVHPMRDNDTVAQHRYESAIAPSQWLEVRSVDRQALMHAARLRSHHRLKLPDAVHVAAAVLMDCTHLMTDDDRVRRTSDALGVKELSLDLHSVALLGSLLGE